MNGGWLLGYRTEFHFIDCGCIYYQVKGVLKLKIMDDETLKHLLALKKTNEAILDGLKTALYLLDNEDKFTPERWEFLVAQLKELALAGEAVFDTEGEKTVKH